MLRVVPPFAISGLLFLGLATSPSSAETPAAGAPLLGAEVFRKARQYDTGSGVVIN